MNTAQKLGSPQQEAIWSAIEDGTSHVVVDARAGVGKTFTLVGAVDRTGDLKTGLLASNRHIAVELQARVPRGVKACTLHSLGNAAVRQAFDVRGEPDGRKLDSIAKRIAPEAKVWGPSVKECVTLARLVKYSRIKPSDLDGIRRLADRHGLDLGPGRDRCLALAGKLVEESRRDTKRIDYDDMIDLPVALDLPVETFELLLLDEAQDTSPLQQALAMRSCEGGRLVVAGDPHQAIYGFSGADPDALPTLRRNLGESFLGAESLPLTMTRRCPAAHVDLVQGLVPDFAALPDAPDGEIACVDPGSDEDFRFQPSPGDLIICRTNAPVVGVAFRLVTQNTRVVIRGRDLGRGLASLVERLKPDGIRDLTRKLAAYRDGELARLVDEDAPAAAVESLTDRCLCLSFLMQVAGSVDEVLDRIAKVFVPEDDPKALAGAVVCSSIHRAKGLEADTVVIVKPELLPHPAAEQPWEQVQERNLAYVAATRSKRRLVFAGDVPAIFGRMPRPATARQRPTHCEKCRKPLAEGGQCWPCRDRLCQVCFERYTNTPFISRCLLCEAQERREGVAS